jgi:hypothetical protein
MQEGICSSFLENICWPNVSWEQPPPVLMKSRFGTKKFDQVLDDFHGNRQNKI